MTSKWGGKRTGLLAVLMFLSAAATAAAATITVTTVQDEVVVADDGTVSLPDGQVSLREAVASINGGASVNGDVTPSVDAYGTNDTIAFAPGLTGTILFAEFVGELRLEKSVRIVGPGADVLAIDAGGMSRVFYADDPVHLDLQGLTITGGRVRDANQAVGGGILATRLTLTDCVVSFNEAVGEDSSEEGGFGGYAAGGGIAALSSLTLVRTTVSHNTAQAGTGSISSGDAIGGGVYARALDMSDSTIAYNWVYVSDGVAHPEASVAGAGVFVWGAGQPPRRVTIRRSTFTTNRNPFGIGGGLGAFGGELAVSNSTFFGNVASEGGAIGANGVRMSAIYLTIAGNEALAGSGIMLSASQAEIGGSIVSGNAITEGGRGGEIVVGFGTLAESIGYNLLGSTPVIDDVHSFFNFPPGNPPPDQIGTGYAGLSPLAPNGGSTDTMALSGNSSAVDAIPPVFCEFTEYQPGVLRDDQRGVSRPSGYGCDIGAYELEVSTRSTLQGFVYYDANANGVHDPGETGIAGWLVDVTGDAAQATATTAADGWFTVNVPLGVEYTVRQRASSTVKNQTGNIQLQNASPGVSLADKRYTVNAQAAVLEGFYFGNVCVGSGGAHGLSYWTSKTGLALIGSTDAAILTALNLRKPNGTAFDPANASQVKSFLNGVSSDNVANTLSAHLLMLAMDVFNGFINPTRLIQASGAKSANAAGYATVAAVLAEANAELGLHAKTLVGSPFRDYQFQLTAVLAGASSGTFVQPAASCPAPF